MFLTNTSFVIRRLYSEKDYQSIEKQKHVHTKIWQKAVGQSIYRVFLAPPSGALVSSRIQSHPTDI